MVQQPDVTTTSGDRFDDKGAALALVALLLVPLFVLTAFAVDVGAARAWRRHSQNAADAGALAGSQELEASTAAAKQVAADYAAMDAVGIGGAGAPTPCDPAAFHRSALPANSTCWVAGGGGETTHIAVASPYDRRLVRNLSPSVTRDDQLIWTAVCRDVPTNIAPMWGQDALPVCTEAVARWAKEGSPYPALFAIKARRQCQNSLGLNPAPGNQMNVYDHDGDPAGLIMSNCPVRLGGAKVAHSADVEVRSSGSITGNPVGGWQSITKTAGAPALADPWSWPDGADAKPDFDFNASDANCYPDDPDKDGCPQNGTAHLITCHDIAIPGEGVRRVTVWRPGHYGGSVKVNKTHCGREPDIHYFMPGLYDFSSNISWDASETRKIYFLTFNGNSWNHPTDPGCGQPGDADWGPGPTQISCPPPPSGVASTTNRGGGATFFLGNSGSSSEMYGIDTLKMYPPKTGPYAGFSMFCNRPNNPDSGSDQVQFDGPLKPPGAYDVNGFFYCQNRQFEIHGDLTIRDGVLWGNDIEWDGGANINVYTPEGWNEAGKVDDFGLER